MLHVVLKSLLIIEINVPAMQTCGTELVFNEPMKKSQSWWCKPGTSALSRACRDRLDVPWGSLASAIGKINEFQV